MKIETVIFDFDGTIVDSYPGILQAFNKAYKRVYGKENEVNLKPFIGPPINEILHCVNGETDQAQTTKFVSFFKEYYDTEGFKQTMLYKGMQELLQHLHDEGIKVFIATNKREKPTKLITEHLLLSQYFCGFYCSDNVGKNYTSKTEMVKDLLVCENLNPHTTVLIGDTQQDATAAAQNGIAFIYASYGFGDLQNIENSVLKPLEILNLIK